MSREQTPMDAARRSRIRVTAWILVALVLAIYFGFIVWSFYGP